jgi:glycosyltransferase involved in cell wall biosynthesis
LHERALRLGARAADSVVIPYGVDAEVFQPDPDAAAAVRSALGLAPETPIVAAIGRMVYKKGFAYLIDAFARVRARHPQAVLAIAGYGDLRDDLAHQAAQLGLGDSIIFPGRLDRQHAAQFIAAADVYVVPSVRDQAGNIDGLPNTLLEGMCAARPIVASRTAGIPDVIGNEQHGLLVSERDSGALAAAIDRLLSDRALAQRLGEQARRRVLEELTWDATCAQYEAAYVRAGKIQD